MKLSSPQVRTIGLGALVLLIALMSIQGIVTTNEIERKMEALISEHQSDLEKVDSLLESFVEIRGLLTAFVVNEQTDIKPIILRLNDLVEEAKRQSSSFREGRYRERMEGFTEMVKKYKAAIFAYSQELLLGGAGEGIQTWQRTLLETESAAHAIVADIKGNLRLEIADLGAAIIRQGRTARIMSILFGVAGVFAGEQSLLLAR